MQLRKLHKAAVVALDPRDAIRALVSIPGVNAQELLDGNVDTFQTLLTDPYEPLFPRALAGYTLLAHH